MSDQRNSWNGRYRRNPKVNTCTFCGKQDERTAVGYALCASCAERAAREDKKRKAKEKAQREKALAEGRCVLCGREDRATRMGRQYCLVCQDQRMRRERKEKGREILTAEESKAILAPPVEQEERS